MIYEKYMQCRPLQWEHKSEFVIKHLFTRFASKKYINNYQIHFWAINAVLMTFKAKKSKEYIKHSI